MGCYVRLAMLLLLLLPFPSQRLKLPTTHPKAEEDEQFDALRLRPLKITPIPQPPPQLLTCDKPPCQLPNVRVSRGTMPVNEHSLAVNPKNAKQMFSSGNDYNCKAIQGLYTSNDGGSTWSSKCMPVLEGYSGDGDVVGDYNRKGVLYVAGLDAGNFNSVVVTASKDNGNTWGTPVIVPGVFNEMDKPWLAIDKTASSPFVDSLYVSVTDFGTSVAILVSHSTDGGKTWKTTPVDEPQSPLRDQFSALAVAKDGTVFVSWMTCLLGENNCAGDQATFWISKSTNGGAKWSKPVQIATATLSPFIDGGFYGTLPNTHERVFDTPVLGIDNSSGVHAGSLYAALYNWTGTFMQVLVMRSGDGGATWSVPVPVSPPSVKHDQFMHWLSVSPTGVVAVTWLDRRNDPANVKYQPFLALSKDGGATFGKNMPLSTKLSNPLDDGFGGNFMGDYRVNLWVGKTVYAVWMDTRVGNCQDEIGGMRF